MQTLHSAQHRADQKLRPSPAAAAAWQSSKWTTPPPTGEFAASTTHKPPADFNWPSAVCTNMSRPGAQSNEYRKKPHLIAVPPLRNTADHRQKQSHRRKSQGSPPLYISLLNLTSNIAHHSSLVSSKRGRALPQMQRHRSRRPCKALPPTSMRRTPRSLSLAAPSCPLFGNFATTTCLLSISSRTSHHSRTSPATPPPSVQTP